MDAEEKTFVEGILPVLMKKNARVMQVNPNPETATEQIVAACKNRSRPGRHTFLVYGVNHTIQRLLVEKFKADKSVDMVVNSQPNRRVLITMSERKSDPQAEIELRFFNSGANSDGLRGLDFDVFVFVELPVRFRSRTEEFLNTMAI